MKTIDFWFDPISPFAYLAFEQLPQALTGLSYSVRYRPVPFAALLKHHGQLGPAEIAPKRDWTYRQVGWLAHTLGVPLHMPLAHPFNPLPLLRLALACGEHGACNRFAAEQVFHHVWRSGGQDAGDPARVQALEQTLRAQRNDWGHAPLRDLHSEAVKTELKTNADEAIAKGLFGVPSMVVDGQVFWGLDALPMLKAYLGGDAWFVQGGWQAASGVAVGVARPR